MLRKLERIIESRVCWRDILSDNGAEFTIIDKLLGVVTRDLASLSAVALEQRRIAQGMTKDATAYARGKDDLTMDDLRGMRKAVGH